jgi:hypothetical protein
MSPSNPLSLLTPAPIGTPLDHVPKPSPRPIGSQWYGSKMFDFDNIIVDDNTLRNSSPQTKFKDFVLDETELHSRAGVKRWEPMEDFVLTVSWQIT